MLTAEIIEESCGSGELPVAAHDANDYRNDSGR